MTTPESLRRWVDAHRDEMLEDLATYVQAETPSDDKPSLSVGLSLVNSLLLNRLGDPDSSHTADGGEYGDARVYDYAGTGPPVLVLCHYDTVWPLGTVADWPFTVDGNTATGPGVFDMKAGLVQAVWALRSLRAADAPTPALRLVITGDEEIGSPISRPIIESAAAGARAALVFEASADGAIKTARKGVGIYRFAVHGIEAHAGLDPDKGANAVDELARAVRALHELAAPEAGTTVNVGVVAGGTRSNITAGQAHGEVDIRVRSAAEAARVDAELAALRTHDPRCTLTIDGEWNRPVMERSERTGELVELARRLGTEMGVELRERSVGGASDGNFVAALGLGVLDGFGAVGDGAHARHEHISISGMLERTALAAAVLTHLA